MLLLIIISICVITTAECFAQKGFKRGQVDFNAGVGYLTPLFNNNSTHDFEIIIPPVSATIDVGITNDVSIGVYAGYIQDGVYGIITNLYSGNRYYGKQSTISHIIVGGRLLYHISPAPRLDIYAGGMLGYNYVQEDAQPGIELYGVNNVQALTYSVLVGARWRFAKVMGVFLEAGYGVTVLNAGLNFKF